MAKQSFLRPLSFACAACVSFALATCAVASDAASDSSESPEAFFKEKVEPILRENCFECHQGEKAKGGLQLIGHEALLQGGDTGPAISLENPAESLLLEAVNYTSYEMPPKGKLPPEQIAILTRWVEMKAPWPGGQSLDDSDVAKITPPKVTPEAKEFWSFKPPVRPEVPQVSNADWPVNPIDAFILSRLEAEGRTPAPPADKGAWLRRATYDLTGLPPTPEEVQAFLADDSPDAYERVIDRLLESPRYGEKWGRHWLDLVRFAETNSYERDSDKPNAWRYRDYVIESFNNDKPYTQFVLEQLAGDELSPFTSEGIVATGYYRLGIWDDEAADPEMALYDELDDIVATTSQVFLGLTLQCARCHDHKLDPLSQKDYYRFLAFFIGVHRYGGPPKPVGAVETIVVRGTGTYNQRPLATDPESLAKRDELEEHKRAVADNARMLMYLTDIYGRRLKGGEFDDFKHEANRLAIIEANVPGLYTAEELAKYKEVLEKREELKKNAPPELAMALAVVEHGPTAPATHVLIRGNAHVKGDEVQPGFPEVLDAPAPEIAPPENGLSSGRRLALAKWIVEDSNPLTARVIANRVWQYHFNRGIVESSSNFGMHGTPPTHPELLDWLATELVSNGWRLKPLHKLIMTSAAYRMTSVARAEDLAADPENLLFGRFNSRRLTAEEIRDSILWVNGSLNLKMGGRSFYSAIPQAVLDGQSRPGAGWGKSPIAEQRRRAVYLYTKRSLIDPLISAFDGADTDFSCPVRFETTQPTQALGMINGDFANEQAAVFADYLVSKAPDDVHAQVELCLRRTLQREPTKAEVERGERFIAELTDLGLDHETAFRQFCLVAINLNEFVYLD